MGEPHNKRMSLNFVLESEGIFPRKRLLDMVWEFLFDLEPIDQALTICEENLSVKTAALVCEAVCMDAIRKGQHPASSLNFFFLMAEIRMLGIDERIISKKAGILRKGFARMRKNKGYPEKNS